MFLQKLNKRLGVWPRGSNNYNLKEIDAIGPGMIDATDGVLKMGDERTGERTNFDLMSSADMVKQNQKFKKWCVWPR